MAWRRRPEHAPDAGKSHPRQAHPRPQRGGARRLPRSASAVLGRLAVAAAAAGVVVAAVQGMSLLEPQAPGEPADTQLRAPASPWVSALAAQGSLVSAPPGAQDRTQSPDALRQDIAARERAQEAVLDAVHRGAAQLPVPPDSYVPPSAGVVTSCFCPRWGSFHTGLDIANVRGTPIYAVTAGVVSESGPAPGFGRWVQIRHDSGTVSMYGHINRSVVEEGERVDAGQQIALMGNRGHSTGPHLHLEIWRDGDKVNPAQWLVEHIQPSADTT